MFCAAVNFSCASLSACCRAASPCQQRTASILGWDRLVALGSLESLERFPKLFRFGLHLSTCLAMSLVPLVLRGGGARESTVSRGGPNNAPAPCGAAQVVVVVPVAPKLSVPRVAPEPNHTSFSLSKSARSSLLSSSSACTAASRLDIFAAAATAAIADVLVCLAGEQYKRSWVWVRAAAPRRTGALAITRKQDSM